MLLRSWACKPDLPDSRCRPERLDFMDVVTSSHNHTDHLDVETLIP
jgi:L-ascorbate metabolism protein UlaG (beta-lactamase superfamily)